MVDVAHRLDRNRRARPVAPQAAANGLATPSRRRAATGFPLPSCCEHP
ncbi:hypothetical protein HMPREF9153_2009 [Cutibacterium avidum ATCC 25577]|uniref:Uncharacterized protein n=1 Tax=Cutibacterium avidum ATCC 25577 TaxID=997355 RepID=G4CZY7_9ACTN|nr:hypothetical protein HMPREF9153_2009 [Cutibacterium avidum ATCC 25577]